MAEGFLPPVVAKLVADISEFSAKMGEAGAEMKKAESEGKSHFQNLAGVGKAALLGVGVAAVAIGTESVHLADQWEAAHARLESSFKAAGTTVEKFSKQIGAQGKTFENLGVNHTDYEASLARLTQATNNPAAALKNMGVVADIAAARHISLEQAATLVGKVMQGNTTVLKRMGIDLGGAAGGATKTAAAQAALAKQQEKLTRATEVLNASTSKNHAQAYDKYVIAQQAVAAAQQKVTDTQNAGAVAIDALGKRFGGSAQTQAKTFAGEMKALEAKVQDIGIAIGRFLIPWLQKLAGYLLEGAQWLQKHKLAAEVLAGVLAGAFAIAITAYIASMVAAAAATLTAAAPFIAIGVAIAAVVAAIIYLWNNWNQIWGWIQNNPALAIIIGILGGPFLVPIFAIIAAAKFLYENWSEIWAGIQQVAQTVWAEIGPIVSGGLQTILGVWDFFKAIFSGDWSGAWEAIKQTFSGIWDTIKALFSAELDYFKFVWGLAWSGLQAIASAAWSAVTSWVSGLGQDLVNAAGDATTWLLQVGKDIVTGIVKGIKSAPNAIVSAIKTLVPGGSLIASAAGAIGIPGFADGGWVPGPTGAPRLAVVHGGEFVQSRAMLASGGTGTTINGGITINVNGSGSPKQTADAVMDALFLAGRTA